MEALEIRIEGVSSEITLAGKEIREWLKKHQLQGSLDSDKQDPLYNDLEYVNKLRQKELNLQQEKLLLLQEKVHLQQKELQSTSQLGHRMCVREAEVYPDLQPEQLRGLAEKVWAGVETQMHTAPRQLVVEGRPWRLQDPQLKVKRLLEGKQLYVVENMEGQVRLFKYTQRYNVTVHQLLANSDPPLAPRFYSCLLLPGGIFEVQMEFLTREAGWRMLHEIASTHARTAALAALERAHALRVNSGDGGAPSERLVLGDARDANVLVRIPMTESPEIRFIDLDWAGIEGQACYPAFMNPEVLWPEGASDGKLMTQSHDKALLAKPLQQR